MNDSPGGASNQQSFLTTKVKIFSLIVAVIGLLILMPEFFRCQWVEWLSQWHLGSLVLFADVCLFFILICLWPIWWSIYSDKKSSEKITSAIKVSFGWAVYLFILHFFLAFLFSGFGSGKYVVKKLLPR